MKENIEHKNVILCVDDEALILESLERSLKRDFEVIKASSGMEGLKILEERQGQVDLIIIDQLMPQMNGSEFLKQVRHRYGRMTSIMLSGHSDFGSLLQAINGVEIFRFMAKPWDNTELLEVVKAAVRIRAPKADL